MFLIDAVFMFTYLVLLISEIDSVSYCLHVCTVRHYEVVYLIHENHKDEVEQVNTKVQGDLCLPYILDFHFLLI